MICALIAWTAVGAASASATAATEKGIFTDALRTNLRGAADTKVDATWKALLGAATDVVSEQLYKGTIAPLTQDGYETVLGNPSMTAFILRYIDSLGLQVLDSDALQGFVMYYDGSCHKKAFKNLGEEMKPAEFRKSCKGKWLVNRTSGRVQNIRNSSMLASARTVPEKEFNAMVLMETIAMRAAAYKAAKEAQKSADSIGSVRKFVRDYINERNGSVLNELKLEVLIGAFIDKASSAEDPLTKLTDALTEESEKSTEACVKLPRLASRGVTLLDEKRSPKIGNTSNIGETAPLDEDGYQAVMNSEDNAQMVKFVGRTASSIGLTITGTTTTVSAFAMWYDGSCARQSFDALKSELYTMASRPAACGGGWIASTTPSSLNSIFKHRAR